MKTKEMWIWGFHSVLAALNRYPELCTEIVLNSGDKPGDDVKKLLSVCQEAGVKINKAGIPRTLSEHRHQGVACRLKKFPLKGLVDFLDISDRQGVWAVLDRIQDPRNFGAIIRSAAAFGIRGIVVGDKEQSPVTGVVAQASAGNAFLVDIFEIPNLNKAMDTFANDGAAILGLDMEGSNLRKENLSKEKTVVWVLGSEGKGLREGLGKRCTKMCSIPMAEGVESLDVSAAATVAFYASH